VTFRPIDVKTGPDGALYIADWSNPIIQHGEVDFRDPRRDRVHGGFGGSRRKRANASSRPDFWKPATAELSDTLLSPNGYEKQHARRVLTERGTNVMEDLRAWSSARNSDARTFGSALDVPGS
jgi:hypothetical protein